VEEQTISTTGSGVYRACDVETARADVRVSGSGNATIRVAETLKADLTGSGDVHYAGDPAVRQRTSGSGDVKRVGE